MHRLKLENISEAGLKLAIQELREEMYDTPQCDFTIAKMLSHCGHFETAERHLDEMLLKWGSSPDVIELTDKGFAMVDAMSATAHAQKVGERAAKKATQTDKAVKTESTAALV
ncbi:hypothetical protein [Vreelandella sp. TE19]